MSKNKDDIELRAQHGAKPVPVALQDQEEEKKFNKKPLIITLSVILGILLVVYAAGVFYFSGHFFPNTTLNSRDLSFESADDFAQEIEDRIDNYSLTIEGQGFSCTLTKEQTSIQLDNKQVAQDTCHNQNIWAWPYEVFMEHDVSNVITASYDTESFNKVISDAIVAYNPTVAASKNASLAFNEDADAFVIKAEEYGKQINTEALIAKADDSVRSLVTTCEVTSEELIKPTIVMLDPRMSDALEKANNLLQTQVELTMDTTVSAGKIDKKLLSKWIVLDADVNPVIDDAQLVEFVDTKSNELNTVGSTRTYTRADGKVVTVSGGTWGWKVNTDSLHDELLAALNAGESGTIDIPCEQSAGSYSGAGGRDWGAYVDIDISEQTVRYYSAKDELLYTASCVTGLPTASRATPTGVYMLNSKQSPCTLVGRKPNGEIDYETKVSYWMPWKGNSVGLHDATWQSSFGGTRYKTNGSHGCVNLSMADAKWFYENLSTGVCVISHN